LARKHGRRFLSHIGFKKVLESERYYKIEQRLNRRPGFIIFISRFEAITNLSVNLICGLSKVPYRKYLLYEIIGEVFQVGLYGTLGYLFGTSWELLYAIIGRFLVVILLVAILLAVIYRKRIARNWFGVNS
jgi:membrane protein DedA with SNARE-associated domain